MRKIVTINHPVFQPMTATDYIQDKLRSLISTFTDIQIRYEYKLSTKTHLIEVIPADFMVENEDYFKEEAKITEEFEQLFPSESIFFISNDSSITIENPVLELGFHKG